MSQFKEYIKIAWMSIKSNKGRSLLTMLGIIIGISSVIMIMTVGNGVKSSVVGGLNEMFGGQIYLYSKATEEMTDPIMFTEEDMIAIREKVPNIKGVTPQAGYYAQSESKKGSFVTYITFGSPDYQYQSKDPMLHGRYFTWDEYETGALVCVMLEESAVHLFGTSDVVGMTIEMEIDGMIKDVRIVGVRANSESAMKELSYQYDEVEVEMPMSSYATFTGYNFFDGYSQFLMIAERPEDSAQVSADAIHLMEARHDVRGMNAVSVEEFSTYADVINSIVDYITIFISFVAAVSLLVGGIGVMNIMLVSVTERTREIGIRKSLGARTGSIMIQFLAEAGMITLIGGLIGMLLGWLGAVGICKIVELISGMATQAILNIGMVLGVSAFSSAVGIFFGLYPARKAAKLSPIEALRHE